MSLIIDNKTPAFQKLAAVNEQTWLTVGNLAELMSDYDKALSCYESALRHNPYSITALKQVASIYKNREQFLKAIDCYKRVLTLQDNDGEVWSSLGHCYLMLDGLQEAYQAYQQALYHLPNPKDPKLWYGIGILYDRYGSLNHAEEAFSAVMKMDPQFEKSSEVYFRLGIIYKQKKQYQLSLQCFEYTLQNPPKPLTEADLWFQKGHVYEQQKEYKAAKEAYEYVLDENPDHSKVLQQLGWLYHQTDSPFYNPELAVELLTRSIKINNNDAQSWYLMGRCYMSDKEYNKAYDTYQQAVYRDSRNPTFWCSIGVLYYQINQYKDALDAYSRAIRLNPYISEVWYNLGTLYESCNNQVQDALDAYQRAAELDPSNHLIKQRVDLLMKPQSGSHVSAPVPQDVRNPSQYQPTNGDDPLRYEQRKSESISSVNKKEYLDMNGMGRNLPGLNQPSPQPVHIPGIDKDESSKYNINRISIPHVETKEEEPKSPYPSSLDIENRLSIDKKDDNDEQTEHAIDRMVTKEDEEMNDASP
ncbi:hypothetical protein BDB01DRAFT_773688 [Pilobolus umbonatus]|nr:hypothetical protein BDB01DRAFT_773688 [Pilobolus umbonatus]